jgi:L-fuconolactonase
MQIIDAQVHIYERNNVARPWRGRLSGPDEVTSSQMIAAMDAAGVDAAIATSPYSLYGFDPSYALEVASNWPDRLAVVAPVDVTRPDIEDFVAQWSANPLTLGLRTMTLSDIDVHQFVSGKADRFLQAIARHQQPLCMASWGRLADVTPAIRRHPDVQFVIDHLGLYQPLMPPVPKEPFAELHYLLALAECPNVAVKVTGVPTLSTQPFPYVDIWPPLNKVFDAFGIERCMWGTDWTRATAYLTLDQAVKAVQEMPDLSPDELKELMSGTLRRIFNWNPAYNAPRAASAS